MCLQVDPGLLYLLSLHVTVLGRDEDATRQCLRRVALELEEAEGHRVVQTLQATLDAHGRGWLMRLR